MHPASPHGFPALVVLKEGPSYPHAGSSASSWDRRETNHQPIDISQACIRPIPPAATTLQNETTHFNLILNLAVRGGNTSTKRPPRPYPSHLRLAWDGEYSPIRPLAAPADAMLPPPRHALPSRQCRLINHWTPNCGTPWVKATPYTINEECIGTPSKYGTFCFAVGDYRARGSQPAKWSVHSRAATLPSHKLQQQQLGSVAPLHLRGTALLLYSLVSPRPLVPCSSLESKKCVCYLCTSVCFLYHRHEPTC